MQSSSPTPWYKQFWPWFLVAIPVSSFIVAFVLVHYAVNTSDSLVDDDYYKEGKVINMNLARFNQAKKLNIDTLLTINDSKLAIEFVSGKPATGEALQLHFQHTTLNNKDFDLLATMDATGIYRANYSHPIEGKWRVSLQPMDKSWKIQQIIGLPRTQAIRFAP